MTGWQLFELALAIFGAWTLSLIVGIAIVAGVVELERKKRRATRWSERRGGYIRPFAGGREADGR